MIKQCPFARRQGEKKWRRVRAHINPLAQSDAYVIPTKPDETQSKWELHNDSSNKIDKKGLLNFWENTTSEE